MKSTIYLSFGLVGLVVIAATPIKSQTTRWDPAHFPIAMQGKWGTSRANCSGADDYGPLEVDAGGFAHYEVSTESISIKLVNGRTYQLTYTVRDLASEELEIRKELWTLSPDNNSLLIEYPDGTEKELLSRCTLL